MLSHYLIILPQLLGLLLVHILVCLLSPLKVSIRSISAKRHLTLHKSVVALRKFIVGFTTIRTTLIHITISPHVSLVRIRVKISLVLIDTIYIVYGILFDVRLRTLFEHCRKLTSLTIKLVFIITRGTPMLLMIRKILRRIVI